MACLCGPECFFGLDGKFLLKCSCFNIYLQLAESISERRLDPGDSGFISWLIHRWIQNLVVLLGCDELGGRACLKDIVGVPLKGTLFLASSVLSALWLSWGEQLCSLCALAASVICTIIDASSRLANRAWIPWKA